MAMAETTLHLLLRRFMATRNLHALLEDKATGNLPKLKLSTLYPIGKVGLATQPNLEQLRTSSMFRGANIQRTAI